MNEWQTLLWRLWSIEWRLDLVLSLENSSAGRCLMFSSYNLCALCSHYSWGPLPSASFSSFKFQLKCSPLRETFTDDPSKNNSFHFHHSLFHHVVLFSLLQALLYDTKFSYLFTHLFFVSTFYNLSSMRAGTLSVLFTTISSAPGV